MNEDRAAQLVEQLRIAEKMIDAIYQLCSINSEVSKQSVMARSHRAMAAVRQAQELAIQIKNGPDSPPPPAT